MVRQVGSQPLVLHRRGLHGAILFKISLMTGTMGQSAPSATMKVTQNQEGGLTDHKVVLPQQAGETNQQGS